MRNEVKGLERHAYAPEMNKLHFVNGDIINVPQMKTIKEALNYIKNLKR
jgi:hypothetical protein